jgi:hypothetical protein
MDTAAICAFVALDKPPQEQRSILPEQETGNAT